ncbi:ribonuclease P protein component [bacterium]|nr:ribonuclease P protein component [bacterium]
MTLPRENRLLHTNEIKEVFEKGKRKRGRFLSIYCLPREDGEYKIAVIVRKRKRAIERNRLRRLIKEAYRLLLPRFSKGHHIVVLPLTGAVDNLLNAKMQDIKEEMEKILKRSGVLR